VYANRISGITKRLKVAVLGYILPSLIELLEGHIELTVQKLWFGEFMITFSFPITEVTTGKLNSAIAKL